MKRFLIPLLLIGAPIAIGTADAAIHMAGCSLGNQGACAELARRQQHSAELASQHANQVAKADAKQAAKEKAEFDARNAKETAKVQAEAERFIPVQERVASANRNGAVRGCEASIRPLLKDPNSYRYLGHQYVAQGRRDLEVRVTYTATNDFGGRVQGTESCSYTL